MAWLIGILFLLSQIAIGVWASRSVETESDYFVAGRRLSTPLVSLSLFATWFGAETCLGSSGAVYTEGLSGARADPFGYFFCLILLGALLARRLHAGGFLTLGDLFRERFGRGTERLAVMLLVPSGLVWGAAQVRAFGQVLSATTDLSVTAAVWVAATVAVVYTFFGGLLGDVMTDAVQGTIVVLGLLALFVFVVLELPDASTLLTAFSPERLSLQGQNESLLATLDRWSVPILGSLVAQELVARVLAARSGQVAVNASYFAAGGYLVVGMIPVFLGLVGTVIAPGLTDPEQLLTVLADRYFGQTMSLIFSLALICAILSTVDSILLSTSALVSHNLITPLLRAPSEKTRVLLGRLIVVASGLFCTIVALHADGIYDLVETASALGTAGVLIVTIAGLYDSRPDPRAAIATLVIGASGAPLFDLVSAPAPYLFWILSAAATYGLIRAFNGEPNRQAAA